MANKKYKLADSDYWESSGVYDIAQSKTQRTINSEVQTSLNSKVPTSRTINGKALSSNISLTSADVSDDSGAGGANVKASLGALKDSLNSKGILAVTTKTLTGSQSSANGLASTNSKITADMIPVSIEFATPSAVLSNVTVNPIAGNVQITGTFSTSGTTATIYLSKPLT